MTLNTTKRDGFYFPFPYVYVYNIIVMYSAIFYTYTLYLFFLLYVIVVITAQANVLYCYTLSHKRYPRFRAAATTDRRGIRVYDDDEEGTCDERERNSKNATGIRNERRGHWRTGAAGATESELRRNYLVSRYDGEGVTVRRDVTFRSALKKNLNHLFYNKNVKV